MRIGTTLIRRYFHNYVFFLVPTSENVDYVGVNETVVFNPDGRLSSLQIMIMVIPDGLVERDETFSIVLTTSEQDAASGNIVIGRDVAQITIVDLDSKLRS